MQQNICAPIIAVFEIYKFFLIKSTLYATYAPAPTAAPANIFVFNPPLRLLDALRDPQLDLQVKLLTMINKKKAYPLRPLD